MASKEQKQRAENYLDDEDLPPEEVEQEFHEFDEHIAALALHGFISKHFPHGLQAQSLTEFYNAYPAEGMILRCRKVSRSSAVPSFRPFTRVPTNSDLTHHPFHPSP